MMIHRRMSELLIAAPVIACFLSGESARADKITLKGGSQISGKVTTDPTDPGKVLIYMEHGRVPLRQDKERIVEVVDEPSVLDQYLPKREKLQMTAAAQFDLGFWCEQVKLKDLSIFHYEEALKLDPDYDLAHEKLGHLKRGNRWLVGDDIKKAQGLVKVRGRWVTATQKEQLSKAEMSSKDQGDWTRRFKGLKAQVEQGSSNEAREAETILMGLRDPLVVKPLVRVFDTEDPSSRKRLARILGAIQGPEAAIALVNGLVNEEEPDLRHTFVDELRQRSEPEIEKQLVKALKSNTTEFINRAAWGISNLNLDVTIPNLVAALTTTKYETVLVDSPNSLPVNNFGDGNPGMSLNPALVGYNGSSAAYLTPPTVGPGVVAFGAYSVPTYGYAPLPFDPSVSVSYDAPSGSGFGTSASPNRGPVPETVTIPIENQEVLSALIKFSGRDYGYDKDAWRSWLKNSFKMNDPKIRKVPQP